MDDRILQVLDFHKIIEKLKNQASTSLGQLLITDLKPSTDVNKVKQMQVETDEAVQIYRLNSVIPLGGIFDIRDSLKRSTIGGILSTNECLDIANTVYGGRQVKGFMDDLEEDLPILKELSERITPLRNLEQQIKYCIDDKGYVIDNASKRLRSIRSSIRTFENSVRNKLDDYVRHKSNLLSDAIITIRNDRYVLPVKHEHRSQIGGIVHDQSASGQTLFMEPRTIVDLNNQLQEATLKEQQEIEQILRELSEQIADHQSYLNVNISILAKIDFISARGKLAQKMDAALPKINDNGIIKMQQARHPLIPKDEVVANDIELGDTYTSIVITGPNTGGKTVLLKMVGLCTLMAQSGLQIPALDGCEIAVFDHVLADIGDEQSIEQNLSTFSSHMTNIVDIISHVSNKTLVLFDELGAGTDPQEGAALAMSILDEGVSRGARVIATTHYPELKAYGYNRKNVVNASVEFNVKSLQPTYRLLIGVPGRSNAFEISKRLGLDGKIIDRAKGYIGVDSRSVENMILSLENSQKQAEKEYNQAHQTLLSSEKLRNQIEQEWNQFKQRREELYQKAEKKAEKAIQKAREEAELIVAELRNMKTNAVFKEHEWIEAKKLLDDANPDLSSNQPTKEKSNHSKADLHPGDEINVLTIKQTGTVLEKISAQEYTVQVGVMRVNVNRNDLQLITQPKKNTEKPIAMVKGSNYHVSTELDIRGLRYEEAMAKLEKYVDDALLAGHSKILIIHGKGTGALRKGVHEFVAVHPSISSYRSGTVGEGGNGVTVIEFK